jgi:hypothetical protein
VPVSSAFEVEMALEKRRRHKIFASTIHNWRPFLHPQPEDAPCRGDRDPLIMAETNKANKNVSK